MKNPLLSFRLWIAPALLRVSAVAAVSLVSTTWAAVTYDFNSPSQHTAEFSPSGSTVFAHSSSGGIADSGWLTTATTASSSARSVLTHQQTFAGSTPEFTLSLNFQWRANALASGDLLVLGVGNSIDPSQAFAPDFGSNGATIAGKEWLQEFHIGIGATGTSNQVRMYATTVTNGVIENTPSTTQYTTTLSPDAWYSLVVTYTLNNAGTGYQAMASILLSDANGTPGTTLLTWGLEKINPHLVDNDVHAYIATRPGHYSGVVGIDNFTVSEAIPEASTIAYAVTGFALLTFAAMRSRRHTATQPRS